jgi:hypothetical protein
MLAKCSAIYIFSVLIPELCWLAHLRALSVLLQVCQMPGRTHWRVFWIQGKGMAPINLLLYLRIYVYMKALAVKVFSLLLQWFSAWLLRH